MDEWRVRWMYVWMYGWMKVSWIKGLIGLFRYNEIAWSMDK